jgi:hypothetical protein
LRRGRRELAAVFGRLPLRVVGDATLGGRILGAALGGVGVAAVECGVLDAAPRHVWEVPPPSDGVVWGDLLTVLLVPAPEAVLAGLRTVLAAVLHAFLREAVVLVVTLVMTVVAAWR